MATAVLPLPTSPCTMRAMARFWAMSQAICASVRRWAAVGAKGMARQKACAASASASMRGPAPRLSRISRTDA